MFPLDSCKHAARKFTDCFSVTLPFPACEICNLFGSLLWRLLWKRPPPLLTLRSLQLSLSYLNAFTAWVFFPWGYSAVTRHETLTWSQRFPSEANLRSPSGTGQPMNERGSTQSGGAHICSPLGCHKDRQECSRQHNLHSQPSLSKQPLLSLTVHETYYCQIVKHNVHSPSV